MKIHKNYCLYLLAQVKQFIKTNCGLLLTFVNGGLIIKPILIDRIQDSEGNTIINNENRKCLNCDLMSIHLESIQKFKMI